MTASPSGHAQRARWMLSAYVQSAGAVDVNVHVDVNDMDANAIARAGTGARPYSYA